MCLLNLNGEKPVRFWGLSTFFRLLKVFTFKFFLEIFELKKHRSVKYVKNITKCNFFLCFHTYKSSLDINEYTVEI